MRSRAVLILTALLLTSTGLVSVVKAGPKGGAGGGGPGSTCRRPGAACRSSGSPTACRRPRSPHGGTSRCGAAYPGARTPDGCASRCCATYRGPCCTAAVSASSHGSAACCPPSRNPSRRHSGRRVDAHRCWPERDARCAHACKTECGSDCVQHSSLGGTSRKARRCTCTRAGRTRSRQPTDRRANRWQTDHWPG